MENVADDCVLGFLVCVCIGHYVTGGDGDAVDVWSAINVGGP